VAVPLAFADKWLLPRIHRFRAKYPDYDLRIDTNRQQKDLVTDRLDIGVWYGGGRWPGLRSTFLLGDEFFPVCNPTLVAGKPPPRRAEDLRHFPLVHDTSMTTEDTFPTWRAWLRHAGVSGVDSERGLHIDDSAAVIRAAIAGGGVALGRSALVAGDLAEGRLVRPFGAPCAASSATTRSTGPRTRTRPRWPPFATGCSTRPAATAKRADRRQSFPFLPAQNISVAADRRDARDGAHTARPAITLPNARDR
jgi:DNA-binding transcriptional LysR family regulator